MKWWPSLNICSHYSHQQLSSYSPLYGLILLIYSVHQIYAQAQFFDLSKFMHIFQLHHLVNGQPPFAHSPLLSNFSALVLATAVLWLHRNIALVVYSDVSKALYTYTAERRDVLDCTSSTTKRFPEAREMSRATMRISFDDISLC